MLKNKNRIIPQMFDVRPVDETGDLDWKKIQAVGNSRQKIDGLEKNEPILQQVQSEELLQPEQIERNDENERITQNDQFEQQMRQTFVLSEDEKRAQAEFVAQQLKAEAEAEAKVQHALLVQQMEKLKKSKKTKPNLFKKNNDPQNLSWREILFPSTFRFQFDAANSLKMFAVAAVLVFVGVGSVTYASKGLGIKAKVLGSSTDGLENLSSAVSNIAHQNFEGSSQQFSQAYANFSQGSTELESMGGILMDATRFVPFATKISSGKNAIEAGKHFAAAGQSLNVVAKVAADLKNSDDVGKQNGTSMLDVLKSSQKNIADAKNELDAAQKNINLIAIDDLPKDKQEKFLLLKQKLPDLRNALDFFLNNSQIFADLLGGNGPRKYLFLFQNNSEMRATGGFIGSYGLLDIANGHIKNFFIDGIFNPDGQLKDRIVPPAPIQKISANWSMHDSNWFA
ncbi:MAG: DUF4012 domain-containing protein, partial [Candidatus Moranbacteria bacterium]|nr:DUF4012 domain-containing protein [Candidatus Moranbacteria bacterium]